MINFSPKIFLILLISLLINKSVNAQDIAFTPIVETNGVLQLDERTWYSTPRNGCKSGMKVCISKSDYDELCKLVKSYRPDLLSTVSPLAYKFLSINRNAVRFSPTSLTATGVCVFTIKVNGIYQGNLYDQEIIAVVLGFQYEKNEVFVTDAITAPANPYYK